MLNSFRKGGVIQFVMGGVIILIIAAFALGTKSPKTRSAFEAECVVRVGSSCVPPRDFTAAFQLSVRPDLSAKDLKRLQIRKMLLDGLVDRELLLGEARRLGISISEEKVDAELALGRFHFSLPAEREGQLPMMTYVNVRHPDTDAFNYEIYQRVVRNYTRMSSKDFKAYQTTELIASRMRDASKTGVRISEAEAYAQFENANAKATVRVAQISSDWFARFLTSPSDQEVQAYAAEHAADVDAAFAAAEATYTEGCPLVSEIFFAFPPAADEADEAETRTRAERVAAQAAHASSAEFETLARVHSGAPSASYAGKRGCLQASESEESAQLVKAVEGLAPGSVSKLVELPRGFHLLRLEQRLAKDDLASVGRLWVARPLAARVAADRLTSDFAQGLKAGMAAGKSMQDALDELVASALKGTAGTAAPAGRADKPSELASAALESRDRPQVDVSSSFSRVGMANPIPNALAGNAAKQLAFTLQNVGDVYPEPIPTRHGLAVLQLKEKEPAKREQFDKEKVEFMRELKERAEADALVALVLRLRKAHEHEITINERYLDAQDKAADDS
jgi:peptidyl-prolyl cis-trans isomerase D